MTVWDLGQYEEIAILDGQLRDHPTWVGSRETLAVGGRLDRVRDAALGILRSANEDPQAFRVASPYVVVAAQRK
jgi:hypothetical protein